MIEALLAVILAQATVDLKIETQPTAQYGECIDVHILARGSEDAQPATFTFVGVILKYDPEVLSPVDLVKCESDYSWQLVHFCTDLDPASKCWCINGVPPWPKDDGKIHVSHVAATYGVMYVPNEWRVLSTVRFAVAKQETAVIKIVPEVEHCDVKTKVTRWDMLDVTGELGPAIKVRIENPCGDDEWFGSADSNRDGRVDVLDWLAMLAQWSGPGPAPADPPP